MFNVVMEIMNTIKAVKQFTMKYPCIQIIYNEELRVSTKCLN